MRTSLLTLAATVLLAPAALALPLTISAGSSLTVVGGYSQTTPLAAQFSITNAGPDDLQIGLERQVISEISGSDNSFCFGVGCYPPTVSVAPQPVTLTGGTSDHSFVGDYEPNGQPGITRVRYAFYDINGTGLATDTAYITISYDASQRVTGLAADLTTSALLSAPAPNPVAAGTSVSLTIAANTLGAATVRLVSLSDGRTVQLLSAAPLGRPVATASGASALAAAPTTVSIPTTNLTAGVYGCLLIDGTGRPRAMRRLVVQ